MKNGVTRKGKLGTFVVGKDEQAKIRELDHAANLAELEAGRALAKALEWARLAESARKEYLEYIASCLKTRGVDPTNPKEGHWNFEPSLMTFTKTQ